MNWIENCQNWKLPKLKVAKIENCQNWKLPKLKITKIVSCQNLKLGIWMLPIESDLCISCHELTVLINQIES